MKSLNVESPMVTFRSVTQKTLLAVLLLTRGLAGAQQMYDNQENVSNVTYITRPEGRVAGFTANPKPDSVNPSGRCNRFARNRQKYDYIKVMPKDRLEDADAYANADPSAPKLKLKVYTTAPAGTMVEIQLGKKTGNAYPEGTHSQYQAVTTKSGAWEELEFRYVQRPEGSQTSGREVDQVTLLFMPGTSAMQTFYFDELQGPKVNEHVSAKLGKRK